MSELPTSPITPIDRMKQWVFDKLQKDVSLDDPTVMNTGPKRESLSGPLPTIIISGETMRSPRYAVTRNHKPSPLKRTWVNYDLESPATNISPTGAINKPSFNVADMPSTKTSPKPNSADSIGICQKPMTSAGQKTWLNYSPHSPLSNHNSPKSNSMPVTPADEKPRLFWPPTSTTNKDLESPLRKYCQKESSASDSRTTLSSQSPVQEMNQSSGLLESPTTISNDTKSAPKNAPLRQNSTLSSKSDGDRTNKNNRKDNLRLTGSHNDLPKKAETVESLSFSPIADKNTALTRSWSTNLDPAATLKEKAPTQLCQYDRKSSLNENELHRSRSRRRSSILSFICLDKEDGDDSSENSNDSDAETSAKSGDNVRKDADTDDELQHTCSGTPYLEKLYRGVPIGGLSAMFDLNKSMREWGSIKIRFQYFSKSQRFQVSLIRGCNIGTGRDESLRLFVKVCLMPGKLQQKRGQSYHDSHDPVFYETFNFTRLMLGDLVEKRLRVKFYNKLGHMFDKVPLGEAVIPLFNYDLTAATVTWQHLRRCGGQKEQKGELDEYDFGLIERDNSSANSDQQMSLYCCSVN